jgi:DNA processing protein
VSIPDRASQSRRAEAASRVPVSEGERAARAELTWLAGPGDPLIGELARAVGAERAMKLIRDGDLPGDGGPAVTPDMRQALPRWQSALGKVPPRLDISAALSGGRQRLVCPGDPEWPGGLDRLGDTAPLALWVTGDADLAFSCKRSVAVTGARASTAYGSYVAAELGGSLGAAGWAVISGGSYGVDAAAHRGALGADGVTVAVTAGGIDQPYPAAHADLFDAIRAHGAVVSEAPPGTLASRLRFLTRSRVIAALAGGAVIVEAGARSGALAVARHARELGLPVMAVPGPVTSDLSAGCNDLIRRGHAVLTATAGDVIEELTSGTES